MKVTHQNPSIFEEETDEVTFNKIIKSDGSNKIS